MRIPLLPKHVSKLKLNGLLTEAWGHWLKMKVLEFNYGMESETPDILGSTWASGSTSLSSVSSSAKWDSSYCLLLRVVENVSWEAIHVHSPVARTWSRTQS